MTYLTTAQFIQALQSQTHYQVFQIKETLPKLVLRKSVIGHPHQFIYDIGAQKLMVFDEKDQPYHTVFDNFNDVEDMQLLQLLSQYLPNPVKGKVPNDLPMLDSTVLTLNQKGI